MRLLSRSRPLLACVTAGLFALNARAATLTVTTTADSGPGSLRATVGAAVAGDVIVFDAMTNGVPIVLTTGELMITTGITITGNDTTNTVVSGNGSSRVFNIMGAGMVSLNALKLTMGNSATEGGAIYVSGTMLSMMDCAVVNSSAGLRGGGIYATGGSLMLTNSWVRANSAAGAAATDGGGGLYLNGGCTASLTSASLVSGNAAPGAAGSGGGIFNNTGGSLTVSNSTIMGNSASRAGGGIEQNGAGSSMVLTSVSLTMNSTGPSPGNGGGVHITGSGSATITDCTVTNNTATTEGGGLWNGTGNMTVDNTAITGNTAAGALADQGGGGIFNLKGVLTVQNGTVISGNSATGVAGSGGGIMNDSTATLVVLNSTISGNSATRAGGGIEMFAKAGQLATATLTGVTLDDNETGPSPGNGGGVHITGPGSMTITGCTVTNNTATTEGGGLWNGTGPMTVDNTTITGNTAAGALADQGGGGIFNLKGLLTVQNGTVISGNSATGAAGSGGGIMNDSTATLVVLNSTISGNSATRAGGGIEMFAKAGQLATATLTGVTLDDNATGPSPGNGGGVHITGPGNMTITGCTVTNNTATTEGGGLWNGTGAMTVDNTTITGNTAAGALADQGGGGIFNLKGVLTVQNSTVISGNSATGAAGSGGGIMNDSTATLVVLNSTISNNDARRAGGGIEMFAKAGQSATATLSGLVMMGNSTGPAPGNGGAVHVTGPGTLSISGSIVDDNSAVNEGGGLWASLSGAMTVTRTTVSNNTALDGGGLFLQPGGMGSLTVNYSTVSGNMATNGGGVRVEGGTYNLNGVTIAANTATTGGGVDILAGTFNSTSSIIGDNTATTGPDVNGTFASALFNLIENGSGATGITNGLNNNIVGTDAMLGPLANNGGFTNTHALDCASPAIGAGDPGDASPDQRGSAVFGMARDIGAFEFQGSSGVVLTITTDDFGSETTWEVRRISDNMTVASGGPYVDTPGGTVEVEDVCLPAGCYDLIVMDASGNGIDGGGFVLMDDMGNRIIDANGAFGSTSASPNEWCVPLGPTFVKPNWCDRTDLVPNDFIYAQGVAGATGYQFWFFDPHGSYSRRILKPTTACRLNFQTSPLPLNFDLNVRVRPLVGGNYQEFGKACRIRLDGGMMRSVEQEVEAAQFSIYPNPNRDGQLFINLDGLSAETTTAEVEIYDAMGKRVLVQQLNVGGGTLNTVLSLGGDFGPGMYLVNVRVDGQLFTERLVRE